MSRGRPPMPVALTQKHLTIAERETREKAEAGLSTAQPMKKWESTRRNKFADKQFRRIVKALDEIGMNDTLNEAVINRYCVILGECDELEKRIPELRARIAETEAQWQETMAEKMPEPEDIVNFTKAISALERQANSLDVALGAKRAALLQIEKENTMTVLAKLRAVPKKAEETEEDGLTAFDRKWNGCA